jgi:hypothetical protein
MAFGPQPTPQTVASNRQIEGGQPAGIPPSPPSTTPPRAGVPIYSAPPPATAQPGIQPQMGESGPSAAPPSDDPSISPVGKPADVSSYLNPALQRMNDLTAKRAAVPAVDPNQVKPKWWERALGVALGATQLKNPENAGAVASQVVNRRLIGAERSRDLALQPIDQQIASEREAFPLYTAAGEAAYRQAQLGVDTNRENRERYTAKSNAGYKSDLNDIRTQRDKDQQAQAADKLDQQQKTLDEREQRDRDMNQQRQQLNDIRDRLATKKEEAPTTKLGTPGQFSGLEVKKQQALSKAHSDYQKAVTGLAPDDADGHKQAASDLAEAQQQAQDAYEQEIISLGGTAQHFDYASQGKAHIDNTAPNPTAAEKVNELGGRKVGDVGVVRGQRVRITNIYKNGKFDYQPATGQ